MVAAAGRNVGIVNKKINVFTCEALFTTVTNVNFDPERIVGLIKKTLSLRDEMIEEVRTSSGKVNIVRAAAKFRPTNTLEEMVNQGEEVGLKSYPAAIITPTSWKWLPRIVSSLPWPAESSDSSIRIWVTLAESRDCWM